MDDETLMKGAEISATSENEEEIREKLMVGLLIRLGYRPDDWVPEVRIPKHTFGKNEDLRRAWKPDYLTRLFGLYVGVFEIKNSREDIQVAWREAVHYANELNRNHKTTSAVKGIIGCNGKQIVFGTVETEDGKATVYNVIDLLREQPKWAKFEQTVGKGALWTHSQDKHAANRLKHAHSLRQRLIGNNPPPDDKGNDFFGVMQPFLNSHFGRLDGIESNTLFEELYCAGEVDGGNRIVKDIVRDRRPAGTGAENISSANIGKELNAMLDAHIADMNNNPSGAPKMAIVMGGAGIGKTTLLNWYERFHFPHDKAVFIYIDGRKIPITPTELYKRIQSICTKVLEGYVSDNFYSGDLSKMVLETTRDKWEEEFLKYFRISISKEEYIKTKYSDFVKNIASDQDEYIPLLVNQLHSRGMGIALVIDNMDLTHMEAQKDGFAVLRPLTEEYNLFTIMTLREETYLKYRHAAPFDAYEKLQLYHAPGVSGADVVLSRSIALLKEYGENNDTAGSTNIDGKTHVISKSAANRMIYGISKSLQPPEDAAADYISPLLGACGVNIRRALDTFKMICHSTKYSSQSFLNCLDRDNDFNATEEETIAAILCGERALYFQEDGYILNVFHPVACNEKSSHFLILQVLRALYDYSGVTTADGIGCMSVSDLHSVVSKWFPLDELELRKVIFRNIRTGCWGVDSIEPLDIHSFKTVSLQHQGLYLLENIYQHGTYMEHMAYDTPVLDKIVVDDLRSSFKAGDRLAPIFKEYLKQMERVEFKLARKTGFEYTQGAAPFLNSRIEIE